MSAPDFTTCVTALVDRLKAEYPAARLSVEPMRGLDDKPCAYVDAVNNDAGKVVLQAIKHEAMERGYRVEPRNTRGGYLTLLIEAASSGGAE